MGTERGDIERDQKTIAQASASIALPEWVEPFLSKRELVIPDREARMQLVVDLSQQNADCATGGPFGAAIFERDSGKLVSVGINLVVSARYSLAHAEMVAISLSQEILGTYDLGAEGLPVHELVTSCEPCAMCFGAVPWSGVRSLICGARGEDAHGIGFDEGPKLSSWKGALEMRGIDVQLDVLRTDAKAVLDKYVTSGGEIYNSRGSQRSCESEAPPEAPLFS